jgi:phosphate transport system permease protein
LSLVISAAIILALLEKAIVFLTKVPLDLLWSSGWLPRNNQFDLPTIIIGTLAISVVAMAVAIPWVSGRRSTWPEYRRTAPPDPEADHRDACRRAERRHGLLRAQRDQSRLREEAVLERRNVQPAGRGIGVGILTVPLVASIAEDAMYAVPGAPGGGVQIGARRGRDDEGRVPAGIGDRGSGDLGHLTPVGETMVVAIAAAGPGARCGRSTSSAPGQTDDGRHHRSRSVPIRSRLSRARPSTPTTRSTWWASCCSSSLALNLASERFVRRVRRNF